MKVVVEQGDLLDAWEAVMVGNGDSFEVARDILRRLVRESEPAETSAPTGIPAPVPRVVDESAKQEPPDLSHRIKNPVTRRNEELARHHGCQVWPVVLEGEVVLGSKVEYGSVGNRKMIEVLEAVPGRAGQYFAKLVVA